MTETDKIMLECEELSKELTTNQQITTQFITILKLMIDKNLITYDEYVEEYKKVLTDKVNECVSE